MKTRKKITLTAFCPPLNSSPGKTVKPDQSAVDQQMDFWDTHLSAVWAKNPDLILLPEVCDRFSCMEPEETAQYYQVRGKQMLNFFAEKAREKKTYIVYSAYLVDEKGIARNASLILDKNGEIAGSYCKNFLTFGEGENGIRSGTKNQVIKTDFGTVGMCICFDLNFHALLESYTAQKPDLLLFSSMYHGGIMQNYWAYHCRSYMLSAVAGVEATITNPLGTIVASSTNYFPHVTKSVNLDFQVAHLDYNWGKLAELKKAYGEKVEIFDPGRLGSVLISSECDKVSSAEMLQEFQIETWDSYYKRAAEWQKENQQEQSEIDFKL